MEDHVLKRSRELESQAHTDPLTGLYNLRALQRELTTCSTYTSATSIPSACS